jgi:hypothetical protein
MYSSYQFISYLFLIVQLIYCYFTSFLSFLYFVFQFVLSYYLLISPLLHSLVGLSVWLLLIHLLQFLSSLTFPYSYSTSLTSILIQSQLFSTFTSFPFNSSILIFTFISSPSQLPSSPLSPPPLQPSLFIILVISLRFLVSSATFSWFAPTH